MDQTQTTTSTNALFVPSDWRDHHRGKGCRCMARDESECGCDADWTPRETYRLHDIINRISQCVTTEHESKDAFIARVRAILLQDQP